MKRIGLLAVFLFVVNGLAAQAPLYAELVNRLNATGVVYKDKLIAVHYWSCSDVTSRSANAEFEKVAKIYQVARLKGGRLGLLVVLVNLNDPVAEADIALGKDGVVKALSLRASEVGTAQPAGTNFIFDSSGQQVGTNIPAEQLFNSINQLITR